MFKKPDYYYFTTINNIANCKSCFNYCKTCESSEQIKCTSCIENYVLIKAENYNYG